MASVKFDRQTTLNMMETLNQNTNSITSSLSYVNDLQDEIQSSYDSFILNINAKYNEVEKRQQGGN